jgi:hypothetical protein
VEAHLGVKNESVNLYVRPLPKDPDAAIVDYDIELGVCRTQIVGNLLEWYIRFNAAVHQSDADPNDDSEHCGRKLPDDFG